MLAGNCIDNVCPSKLFHRSAARTSLWGWRQCWAASIAAGGPPTSCGSRICGSKIALMGYDRDRWASSGLCPAWQCSCLICGHPLTEALRIWGGDSTEVFAPLDVLICWKKRFCIMCLIEMIGKCPACAPSRKPVGPAGLRRNHKAFVN